MNLVRLIYASHLAKGCSRDDLEAIMDISRENNRKQGISGALCYSTHSFLQYLEGSREAVNKLYSDIVRDDRHVDVTLIDYTAIDHRAFPDWSMAYIRSDEIDKQLLFTFADQPRFDPFELTADQARAFIQAVISERKTFLESQRRKQDPGTAVTTPAVPPHEEADKNHFA